MVAFTLLFITALPLSSNAASASITRHDSYLDEDSYFFDSEGAKVFLERYEGSTVLLVFWATWCGACVNEIPVLDNLQKDFRKLPFKVIAVSEDYHGVQAVQKFFEEKEIRHLEIFHDYQNQFFKALSISSLPTALLIDANGKMKTRFKGRIKWHDEKIRAMILSEIAGNPETPHNTYKPRELNMQVRPTPPANQKVPAKQVAPAGQEKQSAPMRQAAPAKQIDNKEVKKNEQKSTKSK